MAYKLILLSGDLLVLARGLAAVSKVEANWIVGYKQLQKRAPSCSHTRQRIARTVTTLVTVARSNAKQMRFITRRQYAIDTIDKYVIVTCWIEIGKPVGLLARGYIIWISTANPKGQRGHNAGVCLVPTITTYKVIADLIWPEARSIRGLVTASSTFSAERPTVVSALRQLIFHSLSPLSVTWSKRYQLRFSGWGGYPYTELL